VTIPALVASGVVFSADGRELRVLLISLFFLIARITASWLHWGGFSLQPFRVGQPVLILFLAYSSKAAPRRWMIGCNTLVAAAVPVLVFWD